MGKNIGFISTRFSGTDGVTMEASKWATVLRKKGHNCFWCAGELDRAPERSYLIPEAHFQYEKNKWINERIFGRRGRKPAVTETIHAIKSLLKVQIHEFVEKYSIDLLIPQNILAIPMHVPLALALTEFISETEFATIAHHHDFYWERSRYLINAVSEYLRMAFPPNLTSVEHVVINSDAQEQLALRTGISSIIIPNVLDFDNPPKITSKQDSDFYQSIGLSADDIIVLQPTRVVQRKGIEHAVELVKELKDPKYKLVVSHEAGDEGYEYVEWLKNDARQSGVDLRFIESKVMDPLNEEIDFKGRNSLWDIYPFADFITYPSLYEGFGNAFLEAIYFKKPMLINRYSIFVRDIEPKGYDLVVMDGFLTKNTIKKVREILESQELKEKIVNHNYEIAKKHFSYSILRKRLGYLLGIFFGGEVL
ncbi:MAG: glycosyltransferase family 4 protein [Desulfobacteraceae bacterium]|nr:glycosyltransferase family 4 protein [Desulfobacteraceae bacterium]